MTKYKYKSGSYYTLGNIMLYVKEYNGCSEPVLQSLSRAELIRAEDGFSLFGLRPALEWSFPGLRCACGAATAHRSQTVIFSQVWSHDSENFINKLHSKKYNIIPKKI